MGLPDAVGPLGVAGGFLFDLFEKQAIRFRKIGSKPFVEQFDGA